MNIGNNDINCGAADPSDTAPASQSLAPQAPKPKRRSSSTYELRLKLEELIDSVEASRITPAEIRSRIRDLEKELTAKRPKPRLRVKGVWLRLYNLAAVLNLRGYSRQAEMMIAHVVRLDVYRGDIGGNDVMLVRDTALIKRRLRKYAEAAALFAEVVSRSEGSPLVGALMVVFLYDWAESQMRLKQYASAADIYARANKICARNIDGADQDPWLAQHKRYREKLGRLGYMDDPHGFLIQNEPVRPWWKRRSEQEPSAEMSDSAKDMTPPTQATDEGHCGGGAVGMS